MSASARSQRSSCRRFNVWVIASIATWAFIGRERRSPGRSALAAAVELAAQGGDLGHGRPDEGVARGEDLLAQVGHVRGVVSQRRVEREHALVLEEVEVLLDVAGGLRGHVA